MTKHRAVSSQLSHKTNPGCSYCGPLAFFFPFKCACSILLFSVYSYQHTEGSNQAQGALLIAKGHRANAWEGRAVIQAI